MPDIFISYSSLDRDRVRPLADALAGRGYDVWWDTTGLSAGDSWRHEIEHQLRAARVVIVCWSREANRSRWVLQEAEEAVRAHRLLPVLIDSVEPPFGFRETQALDLQPWLTGRDRATLDRLLASVERAMGARAASARPRAEVRATPRPASPPPPPPRPPSAPAQKTSDGFKLRPAIVVTVLIALFAVSWIVGRLRDPAAEQARNDAATKEAVEGFQARRAGSKGLTPDEIAARRQAAQVQQAPTYPTCVPAYALECLSPLVRRAVEEARSNAAEAERAHERAVTAQLAGQEAARRARDGVAGFEVRAARNERDTVALYEGTRITTSKFGTFRYRPADVRDRYEGQWDYQGGFTPHGVGAILYRNGAVYRGTIIEHEISGMGVMEYADGRTQAGLWMNGDIQSRVIRSAQGRATLEGDRTHWVEWTDEGQIEGEH